MSRYSFSIIVLIYNPNWNKLLLTLNSLLSQDLKDFEIIIADDGSKVSVKDKLISFFENESFSDYKLVFNEKNQGIVKNFLSGIEVSQGLYIKGISPGDLLYNKGTLDKLKNYMETSGSSACFGLLRAYYIDENNNVVTKRYPHPFDLIAYRKNNHKKIQRNLILYSDHACGAAMCFTKDFMYEYLKKIEGIVIYEEDILQVMAATEGRHLTLFDDYIIWYENVSGISRQKDSPFVALLKKDVNSFYNMMFDRFPDNKWLQKRKRLLPFYKINNLYLRTALRFFANPGLSFYMAEHWIQILTKANELQNKEPGFLDDKALVEKIINEE